MVRLRRSFLISILLHSIALLLLSIHLPSGEQKGGATGSPRGSNDEIVPKKEDIAIELIEANKGPSQKAPPPQKNVGHDCKGYRWYGGVGIKLTLGDIIYEVAPGYPADNVGIKVGDQVLNVNDVDIRGEPGTEVSIVILRENSRLTFNVVRDRICIR